MKAFSHPQESPPARESNPFATCWTQPGALPYVDPSGDVEKLLARLQSLPLSQIVGPHGSGKTTLLCLLAARLSQQGVKVRNINCRDYDVHKLNFETTIYFVEGLECLSHISRWRMLKGLRRAAATVVVTSHSHWIAWPMPLPVLATTKPTELMLRHLFKQLAGRGVTPVFFDDALVAFRRHRGDFRKVWFDLYHLHEQRTRPGRTKQVEVSYT